MSTTAEVRAVTVGGRLVRVAVRPGPNEAGGGPRFPLLLINGIGASLELLQPFVDELDPAVEVIRFDPPGVGGSPAPPGPYRFTGLCRLIADLLTRLGHDRVDVLGISWGGAVAQHFAAFQRARCRPTLILAGDDDPLIPLVNARLMHRLIRDSRLHVYSGGHLGLVTEAAALAPVVDGFLAAASPDRNAGS
jgi:pimeloyl-ACP methyl ester carboxylesterase